VRIAGLRGASGRVAWGRFDILRLECRLAADDHTREWWRHGTSRRVEETYCTPGIPRSPTIYAGSFGSFEIAPAQALGHTHRTSPA